MEEGWVERESRCPCPGRGVMEVGGEGRPEDRGRFEGVFIDLGLRMADLVSSRQKSSKVGDFQHKFPFTDAAPISACWSESERMVALTHIVERTLSADDSVYKR